MLYPAKLLDACAKASLRNNHETDTAKESFDQRVMVLVQKMVEHACADGLVTRVEQPADSGVVLPYQIIGVDGSALYPDRHTGHDEYCLTSAAAHFVYGVDYATAVIDSQPYVFSMRDEYQNDENVLRFQQDFKKQEGLIKDFVDRKRSIYEYTKAPRLVSTEKDISTYIVFDGSFIYDMQIGSLYKESDVISSIQEYIQNGSVLFWYVSRSYSSDMCILLKKYGMSPDELLLYDAYIKVDNDIVPFFVDTITYVISLPLDIAIDGLDYVACVYIRIGDELCRCEIPLFYRYQAVGYTKIINDVIAIVRDQVEKGVGYPPVLAEAHAAAVCTTEDAELLSYYIEVTSGVLPSVSNKAMRKKYVLI